MPSRVRTGLFGFRILPLPTLLAFCLLGGKGIDKGTANPQDQPMTGTRGTPRARRPARTPGPDPLASFLPPVSRWFRGKFNEASPAQRLAWPVIRRRENTLLLAPTGSGKTLATFLVAIDDLFREAADGDLARPGLAERVHVIYVSPMKALGNDIHRNLVEAFASRDLADTLAETRCLPVSRAALFASSNLNRVKS